MSDSITVVGNLAEDPKQVVTTSGVPITSFRIASTRRHFDKSQDRWVDDGTNWYRVSTFRSLATNAHASLRKGQRVVVHGRLKLREWDNGTKQGTSIEIDADAVGHDLLWGTSSFTRTTGGSAVPEPVDAHEESEPFPTEGAADAWAVPQSSGWSSPETRSA